MNNYMFRTHKLSNIEKRLCKQQMINGITNYVLTPFAPFPSRKRQPHTNPVNAASSITYCGSDPHSVRANPQQELDDR